MMSSECLGICPVFKACTRLECGWDHRCRIWLSYNDMYLVRRGRRFLWACWSKCPPMSRIEAIDLWQDYLKANRNNWEEGF